MSLLLVQGNALQTPLEVWYNLDCRDVQRTGRFVLEAARNHELVIRGQSALHKRTRVRAVRLDNGGTCGGRFAMDTLEERFWSHVNKGGNNDCWEWTAAVNNHGYGKLNVGGWHGKQQYAHRVSWQLAYGEIPDGMFVCHKCDNPRCVNPNHLFLGTQLDNLRDGAIKGRINRGENHGMARLSEDDAIAIKKSDLPSNTIAKKFNISPAHVRAIRAGKFWKHLV